MSARRVVSLLPAATEIVCALGARDELVAVSHECDFPAGLDRLPRLTRPREAAAAAGRAGDDPARSLSAFELDVERLAALAPDVVVTQDLCEVCAVPLDEVRAALRALARRDVEVVALSPRRLADVLNDCDRVARALGREAQARELREQLETRIAAVARRAANAWQRPRTVTIEWLDPVMLGGLWTPELVAIAGGIATGAAAGEMAPRPDRAALERLDAEVVLLKPCGFPLPRVLTEVDLERRALPLSTWPAGALGRVFATDGSSYFNRPGPRLVDSLELLAGCLHPELFAPERRRFERDVVALAPA